LTAPNTFAGEALDRAGPKRGDDAWLAARLADPATLVVVAGESGVLVDGERPRLLAVDELPGDLELVLLGVNGDGQAVFAADPGDALAGEWRGLRDLAPVLSQAEGGMVAHAVALLNWHRRHRFCSVCGRPSLIEEAGLLRRCPACGAEHHPRTDPVVIMLVIDEERDRVLLGRQASWPPRRYSALAGFVEPGESLEDAVTREVREEAGVEVAGARYDSSQPWPFPSSLMLGFTVAYVSGEAVASDGELEDARWFSREELADAAAGRGDMRLPPPVAIARTLIDGWLAAR
jgi:NAD+ diphosphatase